MYQTNIVTDEKLFKVNVNIDDIIIWDKCFEVRELKYYCEDDTTNVGVNVICKSMIDKDSLSLWGRYYDYLDREFLKGYLIDCGSKCKYCDNNVYFVSTILDELTKGSMIEYEDKLIAYNAEIEKFWQYVDEDYMRNLCISCDPFYNYSLVRDDYTEWYENDIYYYKYSKKSNIEVALHLANKTKSNCKNERKKVYLFFKKRISIILEDLIKVVFHPERYDRYMSVHNYNITTDNYEYEV